jgi:hypothetical protein
MCKSLFKRSAILNPISPLNSLGTAAHFHLNAWDKSIRCDSPPPSHTLFKAVFFGTTGKVTQKLTIGQPTEIDKLVRRTLLIAALWIVCVSSVAGSPFRLFLLCQYHLHGECSTNFDLQK